MHGALAAVPGWQVESMLAGEGEARLVARFDYAAREDLLAVFPYPHTIEQAITLEGERLTVATTLTATGEAPVPIAFGWHPYLKLPGTPAEFWQLDLPVTDRIVTDERAIPTGEIEDVPIVLGPMGNQTWDDGFRLAQDGMRFSLEDDRRKIEIDFEHGYAVAIIWRPEDGEFICIEPMTAPTNALVSGDGLRLMQPGEMFTAIFSIAVTPS
jgi:galactose mutarotase-like enzyme